MRVTKAINGDIIIDQETYVRDKLQQFQMDQARALTTPEEITKKTHIRYIRTTRCTRSTYLPSTGRFTHLCVVLDTT